MVSLLAIFNLHFLSKMTSVEVKPWFCEMSAPLQDALAGHLGQLLTEVPPGGLVDSVNA